MTFLLSFFFQFNRTYKARTRFQKTLTISKHRQWINRYLSDLIVFIYLIIFCVFVFKLFEYTHFEVIIETGNYF